MIALVIIVALAVLVGLYIFKTQRELVNVDELANNALKQISVQLSSRYDAVSSLVAMVEKYSKHEHDTLMEVIGQRSKMGSAQEINDENNRITQALGRIIAISEQYPELKADKLYTEAMESINNYENLVRTNRMVYNDAVTKVNRMVRQWPSSFVASLLHFEKREYLAEEEAKKDMPIIK